MNPPSDRRSTVLHKRSPKVFNDLKSGSTKKKKIDDSKVIGSFIYEEPGTGELILTIY